jgi:hypothetical protein
MGEDTKFEEIKIIDGGNFPAQELIVLSWMRTAWIAAFEHLD